MSNAFLWIKVLHILAVISWMAGMLYLPRLFVYHAEAPRGSPQALTFAVMEQRLMQVIMLPAMLVTWATGLTLAVHAGFKVSHTFKQNHSLKSWAAKHAFRRQFG
jgi:protoporphyrinogen IX oxidase